MDDEQQRAILTDHEKSCLLLTMCELITTQIKLLHASIRASIRGEASIRDADTEEVALRNLDQDEIEKQLDGNMAELHVIAMAVEVIQVGERAAVQGAMQRVIIAEQRATHDKQLACMRLHGISHAIVVVQRAMRMRAMHDELRAMHNVHLEFQRAMHNAHLEFQYAREEACPQEGRARAQDEN